MTLDPYARLGRTIVSDQSAIPDRISLNPGRQDVPGAGDGANWYKANLHLATTKLSSSPHGQHLGCTAITPFHPLTV